MFVFSFTSANRIRTRRNNTKTRSLDYHVMSQQIASVWLHIK